MSAYHQSLAMLGAFFLLSCILYPVSWLTALLQLPGQLMKNSLASTLYQSLIGVASTVFQLYLVCSVPVFLFKRLPGANLFAFVFSGAIVVLSMAPQKEQGFSEGFDHTDHIVTNISLYARFALVLPMFLFLSFHPNLIWNALVVWVYQTTVWFYELPVIGGMLKLFVGAVGGYWLIAGLGAVFYLLSAFALWIRKIFRL